MDFANFTGDVGKWETLESAGDGSQSMQHPQPQRHHYKQSSASSLSDQGKPAYYTPNGSGHQHQISCDIKPRLTKEQHDILEAHYQSQPKPNTNTKKTFAESLNVSLDKVNNWFQNRRAKSKQDAKKQAGSYNLYNAQHSNTQLGFSSDSDTSPSFASPDYFNMMQHFSDEPQPSGLGISQQQFQEQASLHALNFDNSSVENFGNVVVPHQTHNDFFDSPTELNRRTLTQEQFDAFQHMEGGEAAQMAYHDDPDAFNQMFAQVGHDQIIKQQHAFAFPHPVGAPLTSQDSTVPSSISEQSLYNFPSSTQMQEHPSMSASTSQYTGSRSSSVSDFHEMMFQQQQQQQQHQHQQQQQQQIGVTASQWQPGQSVPVNIDELNAQFRQAAQAKQSSPQQQTPGEHPLTWPDEAFVRRESDTSMLTQQMGHVGIQTPVQQQGGFKSPPPPPAGSIAARRQRPRPAALGLASLRSQSYSGAMQPGSPGVVQNQQQGMSPQPGPLRRIKSSNVVNGIANGRVQKSLPGSAQRSPMTFTFAEALHSPKIMRHVSQQSNGSLAPPTPMSPSLRAQQEHAQFPGWQSSGPVNRQPSISEAIDEHGGPFMPPPPAPPQQNFSSPPHTPMHGSQQQFMPPPPPIGQHFVAENTPPQSAPASQACFPVGALASTQHQISHPPPSQHHPSHMHPSQHPSHPPVQMVAQPPQMMVMEQPFHPQMPTTSYPPSAPHFAVPTSGLPMGAMHFPHGVPMVNEQGELQLIFPQQFHFVPQQSNGPHQPPPQQMHTPPQMQHQFVSGPGPASTNVVLSQPPKQTHQAPSELFVHEYTPPGDLKRAATPRKAIDSGPKNYTFANQTPEHFEKKNKDDRAKFGATDNSPASSGGASV